MSTCLAEVLFGHNDRDHGGILFENRISIYENSVTRLVFEKRASRDGDPGSIQGIWIPNPRYLVETCFLMAAIYGTKDPKVKDLANIYLPLRDNDLDINLCNVEEDKLLEMFEEAKKVFCPEVWTKPSSHSCRWKFLFSLFHGSSLEGSIEKILDYDMDLEVTKSVYSKHYSEWTRNISIWGKL